MKNPAHVELNWSDFHVRVHDLPISRMNKDVAVFIGNQLGRFRDIDMDKFEGLWGSFMHIRVSMDVRKPLRVNHNLKKVLSTQASYFGSQKKKTDRIQPDLCRYHFQVLTKEEVSDTQLIPAAVPPEPIIALSWNCQGIGAPWTVQALKELGISVEANGKSGGLALLWNQSLQVCIQFYSRRHIDASISSDEIEQSWRFTGIYDNSEKVGGSTRPVWQIRDFRQALVRNGLSDLGYTGDAFTWCNRQEFPHTIKERLDRARANDGWAQRFRNATVKHIPTIYSDHLPLILDMQPKVIHFFPQKRPFRFEAAWIGLDDFDKIVENSWNSSSYNSGSNAFTEKLKLCGE
ncbi:UNVERIFIED_CONTAM: hypothetical protein Slati_3958000 [Sesamum latifolium]|uniref:Endonuclease/exonuclease/phosphatase n=1 Tax=Sesamum latifolium TaxID=2727402 RepID=A0AAW2TS50_9LAMI